MSSHTFPFYAHIHFWVMQFFLCLRISFNISCREVQLTINLCAYAFFVWESLYFSLLSKENFTGYRILDWLSPLASCPIFKDFTPIIWFLVTNPLQFLFVFFCRLGFLFLPLTYLCFFLGGQFDYNIIWCDI